MSTSTDLLRILSAHRGTRNPITIDALARALGATRRDTEQLLETSLSALPWPVCASSRGLFLPERAEEINRYLASLKSRRQCIIQREITVRAKARQAGWSESLGRFHDIAARPRQLGLL